MSSDLDTGFERGSNDSVATLLQDGHGSLSEIGSVPEVGKWGTGWALGDHRIAGILVKILDLDDSVLHQLLTNHVVILGSEAVRHHVESHGHVQRGLTISGLVQDETGSGIGEMRAVLFVLVRDRVFLRS